ncbi:MULTISPECIES: hypothetical protein [unclassified Myroides]|uniref:hypothetical protein n=1 Tax=unclassified Myroides TaxID=2642485 RepID=UPI003D2F673A
MNQVIQNKLISLFFLFGLSGCMYAQSNILKGTVMDSQSKMGIEGVTISTAEGNNFTITNSEGDFLLSIDEQVDSVWFSHRNYALKEVSTKAAMLIELEVISQELEEIVVWDKSFFKPFDQALERAKKIVEKGDVYQTYVRAFNLVNNDFSNVADGLVDFYIEKPYKNPQVEVKQNRVLISAADVSSEDDLAEMFNVLNLEGVSHSLAGKRRIMELQKIIKREKDYEYTVKKQKGIQGEDTFVIAFRPKENLRGWEYYEGYMIFTADQQYLMEYRYDFAESYRQNRAVLPMIFAKMVFNTLEYHVIYRKHLEDYRLSYIGITTNLDIDSKLFGNNNIATVEELVVDAVIKNTNPPTTGAKGMDLFKRHSKYQTEFWKNRNIRLLTTNEEAILRVLEERSQP